jgi:hypothetical protein
MINRINKLPYIIIFSILSILMLDSCKKTNIYPEEPVIEFKSFEKISNETGIDQEGYLTISFTDGNGDIGLEDEDTLPPFNKGSEYYYNFYIFYLEKQNGEFVEADIPIDFHSRIPYVEPDLAQRGIKGEIEVKLFINNMTSTFDTIKFRTYIYDRALNKSNTIETPEIIIKKTL